MSNRSVLIIESSNTFFGGGYTLLKQLIDELESRHQVTIVFIGYREVYSELVGHNYIFVRIILTRKAATLLRYLKKRERVLFFCNLPPFRKQKASILYFHNPNILGTSFSINNSISLSLKVKYLIYNLWLRGFHRNVNYIACQTLSIKDQLKKIGTDAILLPFYNIIRPSVEEKKYDFCYVSALAPHKNHKNLIRAIEILIPEYQFTVALTIEETIKNRVVIRKLDEVNSCYGRKCIINLGRIDKEQVIQLYSQSRALIFPSFSETFGLPVVEAAQCKLPILISDRNYAYDLIENPIVFDPENPDSIAKQMRLFLNGKYNNIVQRLKIDNKLVELIDLLSA